MGEAWRSGPTRVIGAIALFALAGCSKEPDTAEVARTRVRETVAKTATKVESLGVQRTISLAASTQVALPVRVAYVTSPPETVFVREQLFDTVKVLVHDTVIVRRPPRQVASRNGDTADRPRPDFGMPTITDRRPPPAVQSLVRERKKWCISASVGYGVALGDTGDKFGVFAGPTLSRQLVCW